MSETKLNLFNYNLEGLRGFFQDLGEPAFRAQQLSRWIYHDRCLDFDNMLNLSLALRKRLKTIAHFELPQVSMHEISDDGTQKWLFKMKGGNCVETVFIPENGRGTLCISSQIGCALNCSFCATGANGFNRDLDTAEIVTQVWALAGDINITNIVLMGMGEPLMNYDHVVPALDLFMDDNAFGLSKYRVTLSTSGLIPEMQALSKRSECALALSLHAPNNPLRNQLVPLNKKYPIEDLMEVCRHYFTSDRRHITMEYVMLDGVNDSPEHARQLVKILEGVPAKVNLIPFNPSLYVDYQCSSAGAIETFRHILVRAGITTITRKTRGQDIKAACGQLAGNFKDKTKRRYRSIQRYINNNRNHHPGEDVRL